MELRIPIAKGTKVDPSFVLPYLDFELNTDKLELQLPLSKIINIRAELHSWPYDRHQTTIAIADRASQKVLPNKIKQLGVRVLLLFLSVQRAD